MESTTTEIPAGYFCSNKIMNGEDDYNFKMWWNKTKAAGTDKFAEMVMYQNKYYSSDTKFGGTKFSYMNEEKGEVWA